MRVTLTLILLLVPDDTLTPSLTAGLLLMPSVNQPVGVGADVEVFGDALDAACRGALLV